MSATYSNIIIHIIFHTKGVEASIKEEHLPKVFQYIGSVVRSLSGIAHIVGGRPDHIHLLASLPVTMSVSDLIRTIKANTSRWIKSLDESYEKFSWQRGYGVFSVSESSKGNVIAYIKNQKKHHSSHAASDEFLLFLKKNGLVFIPD